MIGAPALPAVAAAIALAAAGAGLLRAGWARRRLDGRTAAGWIVSAGGAVAWRAAGPAWDMAVALAVLTSSLAALAWLAVGAELRGRARVRKPFPLNGGRVGDGGAAPPSTTVRGRGVLTASGGQTNAGSSPGLRRQPRGRTPNPALPPSRGKGASRLWTAVVRTLSVGPIAGSAALSLAVAIALRAPWGEADRLVTAGFVLPLAWAVGGVWAMTDPRASRAAAGLAMTAGLAFGGAWL